MTFTTASVNFNLSTAALAGMNNQKAAVFASLESSLSSAAEAVYKPPSGLTATMEALLSASLLINTGSGFALQTGLQAALTTAALLEMEVVVIWEYPVQRNEDLYVTQVKRITHVSNTLLME